MNCWIQSEHREKTRFKLLDIISLCCEDPIVVSKAADTLEKQAYDVSSTLNEYDTMIRNIQIEARKYPRPISSPRSLDNTAYDKKVKDLCDKYLKNVEEYLNGAHTLSNKDIPWLLYRILIYGDGISHGSVQTLNETEKLLELWFSKQTSSQKATSTSDVSVDTSSQTATSRSDCQGDASSTLTIPNCPQTAYLSLRTPQIAHIPSPLLLEVPDDSTSTTFPKVPECVADPKTPTCTTFPGIPTIPTPSTYAVCPSNPKILLFNLTERVATYTAPEKRLLEDTLFVMQYGPSNDSMDEKIKQNETQKYYNPWKQNGKITTEGDDILNGFGEFSSGVIENFASPVKKLQKRSSLHFSEERQQAEDYYRYWSLDIQDQREPIDQEINS